MQSLALASSDTGRHADAAESPAAALRAILSRPQESIDYARAKLAIDRLVDPALDIAGAMAELNRLTARASDLAARPRSEQTVTSPPCAG